MTTYDLLTRSRQDFSDRLQGRPVGTMGQGGGRKNRKGPKRVTLRMDSRYWRLPGLGVMRPARYESFKFSRSIDVTAVA